jgi:hypothetical protein
VDDGRCQEESVAGRVVSDQNVKDFSSGMCRHAFTTGCLGRKKEKPLL